MTTKYRLGVDAGGTFTDFVLADARGNVRLFKATSTPEDGTIAISDGLRQMAEALDTSTGDILRNADLCVNGTTVALNALIQHKGVKTGLICTAGHEDSIEIRLGHKEEGHRYDAKFPPAKMLAERYLRRGVRERVLSDGTVQTPLNEDDVRAACEFFGREGVEAVAVSFVWSVANDAHERRAAEIVREMMPEAYVSVGVEVLPQMREYTRTSTAVVNAYLGPVLEKYVGRIDQFFVDQGVAGPVRYFQSNGGMASRGNMISRAVSAINSGPASAPRAGMFFATPLGFDNIITVDMGGTSFDITLTRTGKTNVSKNIDFLRYRVGTPMIQVETLGAGGGSIAWIDSMGLLKVGPQSAGAHPGPVCYQRGGSEPTVTDANVALGYLNPDYLLGGRLPIDGEAARRAMHDKVARPLGLTLEKAAHGVFNIVNNNMVHGIRRVSIERGYDPRDFVLVAAGGATGLHITALAREIGVRTVLVPKLASGLCAFGQIISDLKYDTMAACPMRIDEYARFDRIESLFRELEAAATTELAKEGFTSDRIKIHRSLDMRYVGQVHECSVDIGSLSVSRETIGQIRTAFDERHKQLYTYDEPESLVELVNLESTVSGEVNPVAPMRIAKAKGNPGRAIKTRRKMIFADGNGIQVVEAPVWDGDKLGAGDVLAGPGVIEEVTTSIVVEPDWEAKLQDTGVYVLRHSR